MKFPNIFSGITRFFNDLVAEHEAAKALKKDVNKLLEAISDKDLAAVEALHTPLAGKLQNHILHDTTVLRAAIASQDLDIFKLVHANRSPNLTLDDTLDLGPGMPYYTEETPLISAAIMAGSHDIALHLATHPDIDPAVPGHSKKVMFNGTGVDNIVTMQDAPIALAAAAGMNDVAEQLALRASERALATAAAYRTPKAG